jgi:hypothetical protein
MLNIVFEARLSITFPAMLPGDASQANVVVLSERTETPPVSMYGYVASIAVLNAFISAKGYAPGIAYCSEDSAPGGATYVRPVWFHANGEIGKNKL